MSKEYYEKYDEMLKQFRTEFADIIADNNRFVSIDIPQGWQTLIWTLARFIKNRAKSKNLDTKIVQIKEKFGELRIYVDGSDEYIDGLVDMACSVSQSLCIECGKVSEIRSDKGWMTNICNDCRKND